jgi:hypothetical protein
MQFLKIAVAVFAFFGGLFAPMKVYASLPGPTFDAMPPCAVSPCLKSYSVLPRALGSLQEQHG